MERTESLDTRRVMLHCELPLNEILVDFNDKIKSLTRGYGSMGSVYRGLLRRIELDKFRVFEKDYHLSKLEKAGRIAAQLFKSLLNATPRTSV